MLLIPHVRLVVPLAVLLGALHMAHPEAALPLVHPRVPITQQGHLVDSIFQTPLGTTWVLAFLS